MNYGPGADGSGDAGRAGPAGPPQAPRRGGPLDEALERTLGRDGDRWSRVDRFLRATSIEEGLTRWLGPIAGGPPVGRREIRLLLNRDIARIDGLLAGQVNAILHHPDVQRLEASWRGLRHLVDRLPDDGRTAAEATVKIRVLSLSWGELVQDQERAVEFDQSQLFRKVYESEFGHPGGQPFGVLLGDYQIRNRPGPGSTQDDVDTLRGICSVAAAAFAPFVTAVHPSFFGIDGFTDLERPINLPRVFEQVEYLKWRALRKTEDARFVGLVLPRVLMRLPHEDDPSRGWGFPFREEVGAPDRSQYLWGNAAYAFCGVLIRTFAASGWLADTRGVRRGQDDRGRPVCLDEGGLVAGLPAHSFSTDRTGLALKCSTDVIITDAQEQELGELGFIPLCHCHDTEFSAFYANPSAQAPLKYDDPKATVNARLSSMLQYMLCVSRFAHYLKVIGRDKVGSGITPEECQSQLQDWVQKYVTGSETSGPEVKARYPLREARVQVRELPGRPGSYGCTIHLRPHHQLDQMHTALRFKTELAPGRPA